MVGIGVYTDAILRIRMGVLLLRTCDSLADTVGGELFPSQDLYTINNALQADTGAL